MSSDAGPSSAQERLRALAFAFYETFPRVDDGYSRLLGRETHQLHPGDVAGLLAPLFLGRFYLDVDPDSYADTVVYARSDGTAEPVREARLREIVCVALVNLPDPPADAPCRLRLAVADTRALARFGYGANPRRPRWISAVMDDVVCLIEDQPEPEADYVVQWRKSRKPATPSPTKVDATARKAAEREAQTVERETIARRFLAELAPGRHEVPDVWQAYAAATPDGQRLGKHAFNALARDFVLGEPRKVRGVRLWIVPEPAVIAEVADRVARLAWADQRAILARFLVQQRYATAARKAAA